MNINKAAFITLLALAAAVIGTQAAAPRERLSLDDGWRFTKGDALETDTNLNYAVLRPWIMPTGNSADDQRSGQPPAQRTEQAIPLLRSLNSTTASGGC